MRTEKEIAERELISAAFHEVSHAAIAKHFGAYPEPSIWRNEDHEKRNARAWIGQCRFAKLRAPLTSDQLRLIGMAGLVGEVMAQAKRDGESKEHINADIVNSFFFAIDNEEVSGSDMCHIGEEATEDHVLLTIELLNQYWNEVEADANSLIDQANLAYTNEERTFFLTTNR